MRSSFAGIRGQSLEFDDSRLEPTDAHPGRPAASSWTSRATRRAARCPAREPAAALAHPNGSAAQRQRRIQVCSTARANSSTFARNASSGAVSGSRISPQAHPRRPQLLHQRRVRLHCPRGELRQTRLPRRGRTHPGALHHQRQLIDPRPQLLHRPAFRLHDRTASSSKRACNSSTSAVSGSSPRAASSADAPAPRRGRTHRSALHHQRQLIDAGPQLLEGARSSSTIRKQSHPGEPATLPPAPCLVP